MPSAKSAVPSQPHLRTAEHGLGSRRRRLITAVIGVLIGASFVLPAQTMLAPVAEGRADANRCSGWRSTARPPDYIRVLRRKTGRVERVPFRRYVLVVLGKEWPHYLPQSLVEAGAVASKQYAWHRAMTTRRVSRRGQCFDVRDGTSDQLYKPGKARIGSDHHRAISRTWSVRVTKHGRLFMTGYRTGRKVGCGRDATGSKLFARSAVRCARQGYSYSAILRRYYGPGVRVVASGSSAQRSGRGSTVSPSTVEAVGEWFVGSRPQTIATRTYVAWQGTSRYAPTDF